MSVVYLGPYIKVKNIEKPTKRTTRHCGNDHCCVFNTEVTDDNKKYCWRCGDPIITETKDVVESMDAYDWVQTDDDFVDRFCIHTDTSDDEDKDVLLINSIIWNDRQLHVDDDIGEWDTREMDEEAEIKRLQNEYKTEITSIKKFFGEDNVSIHWGLVVAYD